MHLWCIDLFKKVGNLCGGFVNVTCSLHDMSRVRILVKKGGKIPVSIKVDDGEVEYRVWLSMEFRPSKLKVDREEYEVSDRRRGGFRVDKRGEKPVKEMLRLEAMERPSDVVKKKGRDGNFEIWKGRQNPNSLSLGK